MSLKQLVTPDSYVVDLGTGSGVLALLAAKAGARKVTAVEISQECIDYARRAVSMNGLEDQVEFFVGHFSEFRPRERADIVVCEMLSSMMLVEQQVPACFHAAKYILKKGGKMIPESATVWLVPVESPDAWNRFDPPNLHFPRLPQTVGPEEYRDLPAAEADFNLRLLQSFDLADRGQKDALRYHRGRNSSRSRGILRVQASRRHYALHERWLERTLPASGRTFECHKRHSSRISH